VNPGGVLYVPRGWWHSENVINDAALRVDLKFRNPTGLDAIGRVIEQLHSVELMRTDFPMRESLERQSSYLGSIMAEVVKASDQPGLLLGYLKEMWTLAEPLCTFGLPWGLFPEHLPLDDQCRVLLLIRFPGPHILRHLDDEDLVEIFHDGEGIRFPLQVGQVLAYMFERREMSVHELVGKCEGVLGRQEVLASLTALVEHGIVAVR